MAEPAEHSRCAWCREPSTFTVGPATTWQSGSRPTQDVCERHVTDAVRRLHEGGCPMVMVARLRKYFYGVTGHTG